MRSISIITAEIAAVLTAASVSSQLDPAAVVKFAALQVECNAATAEALAAMDAETAAAVAKQAAQLALETSRMAEDLATARKALDSLRDDIAAASGTIEGMRGALVGPAA